MCKIKIMKRLFILAGASLLLLCGCSQKDSYKNIELEKRMAFDWNMTEVQTVSDTQPYDVLNENGDTIATNLTGSYNLVVAQGEKLIKVPSSETATKAGSKSTIKFPSSGYATVWAEDLFPYKGDKDFNDVVFGINYLYTMIDGVVTNLAIKYEPRACGSTYDNIGLAMKLDGNFDVDYIRCGISALRANCRVLFPLNEDYLEDGTSDIVIPLCGDFRALFNTRLTGMLNTYNEMSTIDPKYESVTMNVVFNSPGANYDELKDALNLFAVFGERGKEVHMKGASVTSKFDSQYKPTFVDEEGFVWMMMMPTTNVSHPTEMTSIYDAYPEFEQWVFIDKPNTTKLWFYHPAEGKVYKKGY